MHARVLRLAAMLCALALPARSEAVHASPSATPAWTALVALGEAPAGREAAATIYDPLRRRLIVFGGAGPVDRLDDVRALSLESGTWEQIAPSGPWPAARSGHVAVYDPVQDRMIVHGGFDGADILDDTWALNLTGPPSWTKLFPAGVTPPARSGASACWDTKRNQMVLFGGWDGTLPSHDMFTLSFDPTPTWTKVIQGGLDLSARLAHAAVYDPVRDRMLVFGGTTVTLHYPDLFAISLASPLSGWTWLGNAPHTRYGHAMLFDPVRDRLLVFGGFLNHDAEPTDEVWSFPLQGTPMLWNEVFTLGPWPQGRALCSLVHDLATDRWVMFGGTYAQADLWQLDWGAVTAPAVTCPGEHVWSAGDDVVSFTVENRLATPQTYDYVLHDGRGWPGLPLAGSVAFAASETLTVDVAVPVPDTAAAGRNPLRVAFALAGSPHVAAACSLNVHDATTPIRVSLVRAEAAPDRVTLAWFDPANARAAAVERQAGNDGWAPHGEARGDGAGMLRYEDAAVRPGGRFGYRLAMSTAAGLVRSDPVWVDVPRADALALAAGSPASGRLRLSLRLPDAGAATVDVMDVAGRRVASHALGAPGAGRHDVTLPAPPAPGIYLLALRHAGASVTTRVVVTR